MRRNLILVLWTIALLMLGCASATTRGDRGSSIPAPIATQLSTEEQAKTIAAMKPPKRSRPVIAVIAQNKGTETTDFLIPYGVLAASDVADVVALAPEAGAIKLTPALTILPQATTADFDARYPEGADYVIVPKIEDSGDPAVVAWILAQAAKGSFIVGICSGVKTLSEAGLLVGRSATGHWYDIEELQKDNPTMRWVQDRRYVVDRNVITTTGVSASLPISIALVEAIAGHERAAEVAKELGVSTWDARHNSSAFSLQRKTIRTARRNKLSFWDHDTYGVPVASGVDEISLAFMADAWSRTFRSQALTIAAHKGPIQTRRGITLLPDLTTSEEEADHMLPTPALIAPATALATSLEGIFARYGEKTAAFVALQLEYAWQPTPKEARLADLLEVPEDLPFLR